MLYSTTIQLLKFQHAFLIRNCYNDDDTLSIENSLEKEKTKTI